MKSLLLIFFLSLPMVAAGCLNYSERDYDRNTGTFSIPFGEKEGTRNPEEGLDPSAGAY